jgi:hypothetical protein
MTRTRVRRWTPPFTQALRLALRPLVAYFVFTAGGMFALFGSILFYEHASGGELFEIVFALVAGMIGIVVGQLVAVLRARALPLFVLGGVSTFAGMWLVLATGAPLPKAILPAVAFFCLAFPCGLLSLQHRWELFASFWPAVGWIGAAVGIINREGRVHQWEQEKITVWLPVPLFCVGCFVVLWLFYLASKQAMRLELWQSLSGAAARRIAQRATVTAVPRKNVLPLLVAAAILFVVVAVVSPYLFRTGRGDRDAKDGAHSHEPYDAQAQPKPDDGGPKFDGQALAQQMKQLLEAAKKTALKLWPLLLLALLYRPAKRAVLRTHLLTPIVPTPPTERIENLWEYVRIAAEDAGVVPTPADSVEQLLARIRGAGQGGAGPSVVAAAQIYARTRYGFTVAPGDPLAMRAHAVEAARELRAHLGPWDIVKSWWRPLS